MKTKTRVMAFAAGVGLAAAAGLYVPAAAVSAPTSATGPGAEETLNNGLLTDEQLERDALWSAFRQDIAPFVDDGDVGVVADVNGATSRFGSFVVDVDELEADVYWSGEPPAALLAVVNTHPQVTVRFHTSPYSLAELIQARDTILKAGLPEGLQFQAAGPASDATALKIQALTPDGELSPSETQRLIDELERRAGVAVTLEIVNEGYAVFAASRQDDSSPFYGSAGLRIVKPTSN